MRRAVQTPSNDDDGTGSDQGDGVVSDDDRDPPFVVRGNRRDDNFHDGVDHGAPEATSAASNEGRAPVRRGSQTFKAAAAPVSQASLTHSAAVAPLRQASATHSAAVVPVRQASQNLPAAVAPLRLASLPYFATRLNGPQAQPCPGKKLWSPRDVGRCKEWHFHACGRDSGSMTMSSISICTCWKRHGHTAQTSAGSLTPISSRSSLSQPTWTQATGFCWLLTSKPIPSSTQIRGADTSSKCS